MQTGLPENNSRPLLSLPNVTGMDPMSASGTLLAAVLFMIAGPERDAPVDDASILGKWRVVQAVFYGEDAPDSRGEVCEFRERGQLLVWLPGEIAPQEGSYWLDRKQTPHHIDIETFQDRPDVGGGGPRRGIFRIRGDVLLVCVTGESGTDDDFRPEDFTSVEGSRAILYTMERIRRRKGSG
jgi:uncharacterized protein (TIGR03067 family)